uniref:Uncharacterized protein n=1 Tax=Globodera pallida TaxID=36090 RepID=A0A183CNI6_GLOPA
MRKRKRKQKQLNKSRGLNRLRGLNVLGAPNVLGVPNVLGGFEISNCKNTQGQRLDVAEQQFIVAQQRMIRELQAENEELQVESKGKDLIIEALSRDKTALIAINVSNTMFDAKRLIGRNFNDEEVKAGMNHWPFKVVRADGGRAEVQVKDGGEDKTFLPEYVLSLVLFEMKKAAEDFLDRPVNDAVVSVPPYFNDARCEATKKAVSLAGLNVLSTINEAEAAAIAYGLDKKGLGKRHALIFDHGGGSLDVTIFTTDDGVLEEKSTASDLHIGGSTFDDFMVNYFVTRFNNENKQDLSLSSNPRELRLLRTACERAKCALSKETLTVISINPFYDRFRIYEVVTRTDFEQIICADLFNRLMEPVDNALSKAKIKNSEIHDIFLVGGSTRIPKVQTLLSRHFLGRSEVKASDDRVAAKKALESYCSEIKQAMEDAHLIAAADRKKVLDKCREVLSWLDGNQAAEKEEFEHQQKEFEAVCKPIIDSLNQSTSGGM